VLSLLCTFAYVCMFFVPAIDCTCVRIGYTPQLRSRRPAGAAPLTVPIHLFCLRIRQLTAVSRCGVKHRGATKRTSSRSSPVVSPTAHTARTPRLTSSLINVSQNQILKIHSSYYVHVPGDDEINCCLFCVSINSGHYTVIIVRRFLYMYIN